jgi:serine/threonine-protein kinase RsbW
MYPFHRNRLCGGNAIDLGLEEHVQEIELRSAAELCPVLARIDDWMRFLGYPHRDIFAVTLTLHEATANAFRHGNRGDPTKSVRLRYVVNDAEAVMEVEDQGRGFDPDQVPDPLAEQLLDRPGGRGLFLMRSYMTWVSFNREGNRVTLTRRRSNP